MAGKGEGGGSCDFLGNPGRKGSFAGKLLLIAAAFVMTFFFPFSLVALCRARSWWHFDLAQFRLGNEVWELLPRPLDVKEQIPWSQYIDVQRKKAANDLQDPLFYHATTTEIASSWLSQSTGVHSSGHLVQIWRAGAGGHEAEGKKEINRMVVLEVSFSNM